MPYCAAVVTNNTRLDMQIVLYQPDIPQNLGAILRLGACLNVAIHIIEPCGFPLDDKRIKRAAMDYAELVEYKRHASWQKFLAYVRAENGRIVLLTTRGATRLDASSFQPNDFLLFGRESAGVPDEVHEAADERVIIPMRKEARSLNLATSVAMVLTHALQQTKGWPQ